MTNPTEPSGASRRTRRSFIQASAGVALAAAGASTGLLAPAASAAHNDNNENVAVGELRLFAGGYVPQDWLGCTGQELAVDAYPDLAKVLGDAYGGHVPGHFRVPDLRGRAVAGSGDAPGGPRYDVGERGAGLASRRQDELPSTLALTYLISPNQQYVAPLVGEIRAFAFAFAPPGWAICDGSELPGNRYHKLVAAIGGRFGGDYPKTVGLPDLRGRTPLGDGDGPGLEPAPIAAHPNNLAPPAGDRRPRVHVTFCIALEGEFPFPQRG
jgi:microcystin-dependent protein